MAELGQTRSGFVALAGRPNVGKSTLVNAIVGRKVAIVSDKPQTTRGGVQIVLTDLPGVQRPRDELTRRMQHRVEQELGGADAALFVLNADQGVGGAGDVWIAEALRGARVPVVIAVNKVDRTSTTRTVQALAAADELGLDAEVFPVSARTGRGVLRPAGVRPARGARARAGARPHAPGAPARGRGPGRRGRGPRRPDRG